MTLLFDALTTVAHAMAYHTYYRRSSAFILLCWTDWIVGTLLRLLFDARLSLSAPWLMIVLSISTSFVLGCLFTMICKACGALRRRCQSRMPA